MDGWDFVSKLKEENEAILAKIDEPPLSSGAANGELLATLVKMALKNEMEAAEVAAEWIPMTPELPPNWRWHATPATKPNITN